jgi:hypothetical protein
MELNARNRLSPKYCVEDLNSTLFVYISKKGFLVLHVGIFNPLALEMDI